MVTGNFILRSLASARFGLAVMLTLALPASVAAQVASAGTIIQSTAEATYNDAGIARLVFSNAVEVRVDELLGVAAASLDAGQVAARQGPAVLRFLISNTGNGPEAASLEVVTAVPGNVFDATFDSIAIDANDNGAYDPGVDAVVPAPNVTSSLAAGGSLTVFVILSVPSGIADGAESAVNLVARTATGTGPPGTVFAGAGEGGANAVVGLGSGMAVATGRLIGSASSVTLVKWASVSDPFGGSNAVPGATITYGIGASVAGSATVDGLVITDTIPADTQYIPGSLTLDGAQLTDAPGDDAGEASSASISVNLGNVPGGTSNTVTFAVLIEE